jgi:hypothetical protein
MDIKLSEQDIADLKQAGRILHDLLPHIDNLESCGHDCRMLRQDNERAQATINHLLAKFSGKQSGT